MNYQQTLQYMFERLPMFQRQGASAFKKDLGNITKLCNYLNNPQSTASCTVFTNINDPVKLWPADDT